MISIKKLKPRGDSKEVTHNPTMNPNATPYTPHMPRTKTYATANQDAFYYMRNLAMKAPLAPIKGLTKKEKIKMQAEPLGKHITFQELLALSTAVSVAEFALE